MSEQVTDHSAGDHSDHDHAHGHGHIDPGCDAAHGGCGDRRGDDGAVRGPAGLGSAEVSGSEEQPQVGGVDRRCFHPDGDIVGARSGGGYR